MIFRYLHPYPPYYLARIFEQTFASKMERWLGGRCQIRFLKEWSYSFLIFGTRLSCYGRIVLGQEVVEAEVLMTIKELNRREAIIRPIVDRELGAFCLTPYLPLVKAPELARRRREPVRSELVLV